MRDPRFSENPIPVDALAKEAERKSGDYTVTVHVWFTASPGDSVDFVAGRTPSRAVASAGARAWARAACAPGWTFPDKDGVRQPAAGLDATIFNRRGQMVERHWTQPAALQCDETDVLIRPEDE